MVFGVDFFQIIDGNPGIYLGGLDAGMTQHLLDVSDRCSVFEHVGGTGVAQSVGGDFFPDCRAFNASFYDVIYGGQVHFPAKASGNQISLVLIFDKTRAYKQDIVSDKSAYPLA